MRNGLFAAVALSALIGSGALAASDNSPGGQPGEGPLHHNSAQPQTRSPNNGPGRVDHPGFTVHVGTVVPHDIRVTLLPAEIVEVVPTAATTMCWSETSF